MKNSILYVRTILLNAVFNPPLEIVHRSGQQLLIDLVFRNPYADRNLKMLQDFWRKTNGNLGLKESCLKVTSRNSFL
jgi:hypothetical protein